MQLCPNLMRITLVASIVWAALGLSGCGGGGGGGGDSSEKPDPQAFSVAKASFEGGDLTTADQALSHMDQAHTLGPNGRTLYAVTTALAVTEEAKQAGSPFRTLLHDMGYEAVGNVLNQTFDLQPLSGTPKRAARTAAAATGTEPYRGSAEALIQKAKRARELLEGISGTVSFPLTIDGQTVEVDTSDALAAKATLGWVIGQLEFGLAYEVTYVNHTPAGPEVTANNLQDLRLATDSAAHLAASKAALMGALRDAQAAGDSILAETDDQTDDLLTLDPEEEALWPRTKALLEGAASSLSSSGYAAIPVFEGGDVTETSPGHYQKTLYLGYVKADPSVFFDHPFDGAKVKEDFDAGRAVVAYEELTDDFTDESDWQTGFSFTSASYLAGFVKSVSEDAAFVTGADDLGLQQTQVLSYLRASSGGLPLADAQGRPLALSEAPGVQTTTVSWQAAPGLGKRALVNRRRA
ncbi:MAG: hypothetical protein HZB55_17340 [Deltaproteobacteria bacterium]|nr:hypothetical protein [Deltaproteobacteria bacterium]